MSATFVGMPAFPKAAREALDAAGAVYDVQICGGGTSLRIRTLA